MSISDASLTEELELIENDDPVSLSVMRDQEMKVLLIKPLDE